jgi:hypothetical protein
MPSTDGLPLREIEAHLATMTYKPGWRMAVVELPPFSSRFHLAISFYAEDAYGSGKQVKIGRHYPLRPPIRSLDQFEHAVFTAILDLEKHEAREWFRVGGVMKLDPHRSA